MRSRPLTTRATPQRPRLVSAPHAMSQPLWRPTAPQKTKDLFASAQVILRGAARSLRLVSAPPLPQHLLTWPRGAPLP